MLREEELVRSIVSSHWLSWTKFSFASAKAALIGVHSAMSCALLKFAVKMPTTSPFLLSTGPPLLP